MKKILYIFLILLSFGCAKTNSEYSNKLKEAFKLQQLEYFDKALALCNEAIAIDAELPDAYKARGGVKLSMSYNVKDENEKIKVLKDALADIHAFEARGGDGVNSTKFYILNGLGQNQLALNVADELISKNLEDGNAHFLRGLAMLELGNKKEAKKSFERAQTLGKHVDRIWLKDVE